MPLGGLGGIDEVPPSNQPAAGLTGPLRGRYRGCKPRMPLGALEAPLKRKLATRAQLGHKYSNLTQFVHE